MDDAKKVTVEYEDGATRELEKGMAVEIKGNSFVMTMLHIDKFDIVQLAYGLVSLVSDMGLDKVLEAYAAGEIV